MFDNEPIKCFYSTDPVPFDLDVVPAKAHVMVDASNSRVCIALNWPPMALIVTEPELRRLLDRLTDSLIRLQVCPDPPLADPSA